MHRYQPSTIDGVPVDANGSFAEGVASAIVGGRAIDIDARSAGTPTAVDPAPGYLVMAFHGSAADVGAASDGFSSSLTSVDPGASRNRKAHGVSISSGTFAQGGRTMGYAIARPRREVLLVGLAFSGDPVRAEAAVTAMLDAAST